VLCAISRVFGDLIAKYASQLVKNIFWRHYNTRQGLIGALDVRYVNKKAKLVEK
jgi:hypothetical protein